MNRSVFVRVVSVFLFTICIGLVSAAAADEAAIRGAIVDPLGARVTGAKVTLTRDGTQTAETVSDARGEYAFNAVASDRYQILVMAAGFEPQSTAPFFAGAGRTIVDVSLQIGQLRQDVVVTASANAAPESQVGAAVTVIDRDTLDALAKPDVLEALRIMPGADVVQI